MSEWVGRVMHGRQVHQDMMAGQDSPCDVSILTRPAAELGGVSDSPFRGVEGGIAEAGGGGAAGGGREEGGGEAGRQPRPRQTHHPAVALLGAHHNTVTS